VEHQITVSPSPERETTRQPRQRATLSVFILKSNDDHGSKLPIQACMSSCSEDKRDGCEISEVRSRRPTRAQQLRGLCGLLSAVPFGVLLSHVSRVSQRVAILKNLVFLREFLPRENTKNTKELFIL
jgi:hypothetical protein